MPSIINVNPETIERDIYAANTPVLLDLWAPWCAPCRALAPTLEKLAAASSGSLQVAKLDVEQYPDIMAQFGVRGIPALILFKHGQEVSREVGVKSYAQLTDWLAKSSIEISASDTSHFSQAKYGAFYGDESLRDFLCNRLHEHALRSEIEGGITPFWVEGKGTPCAGLVHSAESEVFARITGLEAPIGNLIDFIRSGSPEEIKRLCDALKAGSDLSLTPSQFVHSVLGTPEFDWPAILINCAEINDLREECLPMIKLSLEGKLISKEQSETVLRKAQSFDNHEDVAVRAMASIISLMIPAPALAEQDTWAQVFMLLNQLVFIIAQHKNGWSVADRNMEEIRHYWFTERAEKTETGEFSDEELSRYREQWFKENEAYQVKEAAFFDNYEQTLQPVEFVVRNIMIDLFKKAPAFTNA